MKLSSFESTRRGIDLGARSCSLTLTILYRAILVLFPLREVFRQLDLYVP